MDSQHPLVSQLGNLSIAKDTMPRSNGSRKRKPRSKKNKPNNVTENDTDNKADMHDNDIKADMHDKEQKSRKHVKDMRNGESEAPTTTSLLPPPSHRFHSINDHHAAFPPAQAPTQPPSSAQSQPQPQPQPQAACHPPPSCIPTQRHPATFFHPRAPPFTRQENVSQLHTAPTQDPRIRYVHSAPPPPEAPHHNTRQTHPSSAQDRTPPLRRPSRLATKSQARPQFFDPSLVVSYVRETTVDNLVHPPRSSSPKYLQKLTKPTPTLSYFSSAKQPPKRLDSPKSLLVVLDLNGVLVARSKNSKRAFVPRPGLEHFLDYLFTQHSVMVWSSGMPENVVAIVERVLPKHHHEKLMAVWSRNTLRLPPHLFRDKVQVYKQLSWLWENVQLQNKAVQAGVKHGWNQANTVLIDDSLEKAAAEPYNLIEVNDFTNAPDQKDDGTLAHVVHYLERIRWYDDVSSSMRETPFVVKPR